MSGFAMAMHMFAGIGAVVLLALWRVEAASAKRWKQSWHNEARRHFNDTVDLGALHGVYSPEQAREKKAEYVRVMGGDAVAS